MKKISDHINLYQSAFWQLNSTVCHHQNSTIVWDPAYSEVEIKAIHNAVGDAKGLSRFLIYTHGDFDHIAGGPIFTDFKKVGSSLLSSRSDQSNILNQIHEVDHEFYLNRTMEIEFPVLDFPINLNSSEVTRLGNIDVIFYKAAGHTADGLFTVVPALNLLVAGDYLSDIEFPFIEDGVEEYYKTLEIAGSIIRDHPIHYMVPGHGQPANSKLEVNERIDKSKRYLDSLLRKEGIPDWRESWGMSPFYRYLDKAHQKNISYVRSQSI